MGSLLWDAIQYVSSSTFVNGVTMIGGAISLVTSLVAVLVVIRVVRSLPPNSGFFVHLGLGGLRMRFIRGDAEPTVPADFAVAIGDEGDGRAGPEPESFDQFVARHAGDLLRDARAATISAGLPRHEAEDLMQDALSVLADKWDRARDAKAGPRAYLYGIMRNLARRRWRRRIRDDEVTHEEIRRRVDEVPTPEDAAVARCDTERLLRALHRLTADRREVIVLVYLRGLTVAEAAVRLGKSETAVRTLLSKGLKNLRRFLNEDEEGTS